MVVASGAQGLFSGAMAVKLREGTGIQNNVVGVVSIESLQYPTKRFKWFFRGQLYFKLLYFPRLFQWVVATPHALSIAIWIYICDHMCYVILFSYTKSIYKLPEQPVTFWLRISQSDGRFFSAMTISSLRAPFCVWFQQQSRGLSSSRFSTMMILLVWTTAQLRTRFFFHGFSSIPLKFAFITSL